MTNKSTYNTTERIGVNAVEKIILKEFGWIFRDQPIIDMGIDAHIESVEGGKPTGNLIGLQIKTGSSHFSAKNDGLVYYGKNEHLNYWLNHSLPVVLIGHLPETGKTYWVNITNENIEKTNKAWRVTIPYSQELNSDSQQTFIEILEGPPEAQRLRKLFFNKYLMILVESGGEIFIETQEWHNKSLGRGPISLIVKEGDNEEEIIEREWNVFYIGYSIEELIQSHFPWADINIDEEFYDSHFDGSVYEIYPKPYLETYLGKIYPYQILSGEVGLYRLKLTLNELGKSFLIMSEFLEHGT